jgi:hypothetical protein
MAPLLFAPALTLKPLLMITAVGGALVGWWGGWQSAKITAQGQREARRQAEIARLRADNQALAARLERLQTAAPPPPPNNKQAPTPGKPTPDSAKTSFLKRILQANLILRASPEDHAGTPND